MQYVPAHQQHRSSGRQEQPLVNIYRIIPGGYDQLVLMYVCTYVHTLYGGHKLLA
jgi:hypothetical protein